jgi:hypothetical protein
MGRIQNFARIVDATKRDTDDRLTGLRLQAGAWRILTMIALVDQERGAKLAQMLLFHTVPWVDGKWVEQFILENEGLAETSGLAAGVFTR